VPVGWDRIGTNFGTFASGERSATMTSANPVTPSELNNKRTLRFK
jgi:hypothetical protein